MRGRTRKTLVATAPDGTEVTEQTSGGYTVAGLIQHEGGQWFIARHGSSWDSVRSRTSALYGRGYYKAWHVADLIEVTAPIVREYFGTHNVSITATWREAIYTGLTETALRGIVCDGLRVFPRHVDGVILTAREHPGTWDAGIQAAGGIAAIRYEDGTVSLELRGIKAGWQNVSGSRPAGRASLRDLACEGVTAVEVRGPGGRTANFQMPEIIKSMNARNTRA